MANCRSCYTDTIDAHSAYATSFANLNYHAVLLMVLHRRHGICRVVRAIAVTINFFIFFSP